MNKNNRRSSLRKAPNNEDDTTTTAMRIKRRISFSGKNSVREFVNTEEPKNWDNSYEVSDHLNVDSSGSGSGSGSHSKVINGEDKENISLPAASICERSHIDIMLNLQTSVDVTLLPCELLRKQQQMPLTAVRESLALSLEERQRLQDTFYDRRIMDKTLDLMSGSLVARMQKSTMHNTSGGDCPPELAAPNTERENSAHATAANCISDSFMDITPLAFNAPPAAPAPVAPASHLPIQQLEPEDIELEMFDDKLNLIMQEKENVNPAQKSLLMEMEEAGKQIKNKTQHEVMDISFACSLNVSPERDILPQPNMTFESASSANSTINFKDESILIPHDMISGKRISKKINLRQLNDELEAGKIQLFPNGPKTPTTDRKTQKKRFWHGLDAEEECPARDIRSTIKPRAMLNFSESMAMSPQPKELKDKAKEKDKEDKRKYRFSQADEMMLDNTNFLAHARLGDETQSRNTSKNSTRRETTYDYSELDLEGPTSRQDFHPPMPSSRPRQTIHQPEEIEADKSAAFSATPAAKTTAPPPRRTLYMNESMDQVTDKRREETKAPVNACMRTKRRETLVMQVSMEEEMDFSMKDPPDECQKATKSRQTLLLAEPIREEVHKEPSTSYPSSKPRKTITVSEGIEEDMSILQPREQSLQKYKALEAPHPPKSRQTLLMAEQIEEEEVAAFKPNNQFPEQSRSRPRNTILMAEPIPEDLGCKKSVSMQQTLVQEELDLDMDRPAGRHDFRHPMPSSKPRQTIHQPEEMQHDLPELPAAIPGVKTSLPRRTLYMNESIEPEVVSEQVEVRKEHDENLKANVPASIKTKRRETLLMQESMEEDIVSPLKELNLKSSAVPMDKGKPKARHTLHMAEPLEVEKDLPLKASAPPKTQLKSRQTLLLDEAMEEEMDTSMKDSSTSAPEKQSNIYSHSKSRKTIIMSKPIEEDHDKEASCNTKSRQTLDLEANQPSKCRKTLINPEPIEEDDIVPHLREQSLLKLPRHTQYLGEPIEEEMHSNNTNNSNYYQPPRPRKTIINPEPIQEDDPHPHLKEQSLIKLPRHTQYLGEPIEEEMHSNDKENSNYYQPSRPRKTILKSEPMEEEPKQRLPLEVSTETEMHTKANRPSKCRKTLINPEPVEEDDIVPHLKEQSLLKLPRHTQYLGEPIEEEMHSNNKNNSNYYQPPRPRKTIINPEPIEEDDPHPHLKEQSLLKLPRHTQYLGEPIEEEMHPNEKENSNYYQPPRPRKTIIKSEPMEEEPKHNTTELLSLPYQQKKSRQTLVMAEPIEEDHQEALKANKILTQAEKPRLRSRNTLLMAEPILEDKPVSLDYQSPQETMQNTDIQVITPLPNPRLTSIYRELGTFTPGMSLTEFEDQEEMCKTPLPSAKLKQRSIYQPTKMELMDASAFGTPVSHGTHKRQPKHLTPNLPESKKRHTQLFADSQMEMDVDMEDGAWEGATIELEAHKARSTFRLDQFDETVQPVRDYRAPLAQLVKVSSLDDVLEVKQPSELEEKPITISDVSNYFLQEKQEEQRKSSDRESGASSDRTFKSYAVTNTKFINLSGDTTIFAGAVDVDEAEEEEIQNQIDNEQISLVSTLAEETVEAEKQEQPELCQVQIAPFVIAGSKASCKKCGNCNRSLSETTLSADSFVLPQQNLFDFTKESQRLRRLRLKPSYEEMQKHWEMKSLEMENEFLDETRVEEKPLHWDKAKLLQKLKRPQSRRNRALAPAKSRESFFERLDRLLAEQQPNWIFDFQLKVSHQLIFYHRLLTTFRIVVNYQVLDDQDESAIRVCSIAEDHAVASPPERWTTFDHYLNFQLSLKLPMNLTDAIVGSDVECFRKFLHRIDQNVVEIKRTFHKLMTVLTATNARLLRQSNRIFVRKTVIKCIEDEPLVRYERLNFLVQITNVEEICFSDVLQPELYLFNENLQFLPKGIAFLEAFLPNPEQYLKTQT